MTPRLYVLPCRLVVSSCLDALAKESAAKEPSTQRLFCGAVDLPSTRTRVLKDPQTTVNGKIQAFRAVRSIPPRQEHAIVPLCQTNPSKGRNPVRSKQLIQRHAAPAETCRVQVRQLCGSPQPRMSVRATGTLARGMKRPSEAQTHLSEALTRPSKHIGGTQNIVGGMETALMWLRQEARNRLSGA